MKRESERVLWVCGGIAVLGILLRWVWKTVDALWFTPKHLERCLTQQGLVGNPYTFLIGDMKDASKLRNQAMQTPISFTNDHYHRIHPFLHQLLRRLGNNRSSNCFTWMGPVPTILITQGELIRDGFNRMSEFRKPKLNPLTELLAPGLANHEGQKWAQHRKVLNPAFHPDKLKVMLPAFETSIKETMSKWEQMITVSKTKGSAEVDLWPYLTTLTADGISRAAFGSSYGDGRTIFELLTEQKELVIRLLKYSYIPGWKYLPTEGKKRMDRINIEIRNLLKKIIEKRKKAMEDGEAPKDDLLGILLDSNSKETTSFSESGGNNKRSRLAMSFSEVIDECKLFFFAGQETTSVLLTWTMVLLSKHQDWQTRAREEVVATFGLNKPDYDGLHSRLKIVTMILYEVLRLYPSIVATSRKVYDHETRLGNLIIPPGVAVSFSILHAHLDQEVWGKDANEFNPQRFSQGVASATKGNNNSFFPFGWGPRICIGQTFALIEAKMALSMILQRFQFELSPSYIHAPTSLIALQPQHGAHVILHQL